MKRFILAIVMLTTIATASMAEGLPTQADLAFGLVEGLGWSFGLPDKPETSDYLAILNGMRTWRFEYEDIYVPSAEAPLAPKEIRSFGPFSGKVWQRAPARDVETDISFLLPLSGTYEIRASLTNPGYTFRIDNATFTADGERNFSEVVFGSAELAAGSHDAKVTVPARGGIDYLLLSAPPTTSIAPAGGWIPDKELTLTDLAVVVSRTLDLEPFLRPLAGERIIEAEAAPAPEYTTECDDCYQGPMTGEWLRTDIVSATYTHLFEIGQAGIYDLSLSILARSPVSGSINGKYHFAVTPMPYFTVVPAGTVYLEKGTNQIDIELPPRSGLDSFILKPRASTPEDYLRLTGIGPEGQPTREQLDRILQLLAAIGVRR